MNRLPFKVFHIMVDNHAKISKILLKFEEPVIFGSLGELRRATKDTCILDANGGIITTTSLARSIITALEKDHPTITIGPINIRIIHIDVVNASPALAKELHQKIMF